MQKTEIKVKTIKTTKIDETHGPILINWENQNQNQTAKWHFLRKTQ